MQTLMLLLTVMLLAGDGTKDNAQAELDKLQGHWIMISETVGGIQVDKERMQDRSLDIQGNRYFYKSPVTGGEKGTFQIDPSTTPKAIDGTSDDGPDKGRTRHSLFEIQGDNLTFCVAPIGQKRPTEMVSKPHTQIIVVTYQRAAQR